METADWVLCTNSAALVKLPVSAIAMNVRSWSMSMSAVMGGSAGSATKVGTTTSYISQTMIDQIKNIRFTYQFTSATDMLSETSGGRFGSLAASRRPRCAALLSSHHAETRP